MAPPPGTWPGWPLRRWENEDFRALCGLEELRLAYGNPPYNRTLYTTNALLERFPEAIGVKTGYTDGAGVLPGVRRRAGRHHPDYRHAGRGGCDRHPHPPLRALFPAAGPGGPVRLHRRADGAGGGRRRGGGPPSCRRPSPGRRCSRGSTRSLSGRWRPPGSSTRRWRRGRPWAGCGSSPAGQTVYETALVAGGGGGRPSGRRAADLLAFCRGFFHGTGH